MERVTVVVVVEVRTVGDEWDSFYFARALVILFLLFSRLSSLLTIFALNPPLLISHSHFPCIANLAPLAVSASFAHARLSSVS